MSDNNSLIIKNGTCYIDGKLVNTDITVSGGKIKSIGKADLNNHKVYDLPITLSFGSYFDEVRGQTPEKSTKCKEN